MTCQNLPHQIFFFSLHWITLILNMKGFQRLSFLGFPQQQTILTDNKELFKLANEFRSEVGKMALSVHTHPRLQRVQRQQSHVSVKEFMPINSLKIYSESAQLATVNNKSSNSQTWHFGKMSYLIYISTLNYYLNQTLNGQYPRHSFLMTVDTL